MAIQRDECSSLGVGDIPLRTEPPQNATRVGWRNLTTGELRTSVSDPGYGWCPIYVKTEWAWISV